MYYQSEVTLQSGLKFKFSEYLIIVRIIKSDLDIYRLFKALTTRINKNLPKDALEYLVCNP